ncbi:MAG: hydrogenase expression/formation protein HypE [Desulfobacteraceae bacterium]|nr:hydrogenase expression/formation protein HypE [Desulfobacteraceae bacterium]
MNPKEFIVLEHGAGAKYSHDLISLITDTLGDIYLGEMEDSAVLSLSGTENIAITTDSFVVSPMFFGNGNIGKIAVCGTVNDIAVSGANPVYLTLAMIIEAGLRMDDLKKIIETIRDTAHEAGVKIIAGDTKVVNKREADGIFINTTGIGIFKRQALSMQNVKPGDKIILSGPIGNHSIHLLSIREGLGFETRVLSDCAPLNHMIDDLLSSRIGNKIRSIRDVTRGGLGAVLQEYSRAVNHLITFNEDALPLQFETVMAADMLGINPLHLANEGCVCLFADPEVAEETVKILSGHSYGEKACIIGEISDEKKAEVKMLEKSGELVTIEELEGAELPRLC